jgi:hypothetical protein
VDDDGNAAAAAKPEAAKRPVTGAAVKKEAYDAMSPDEQDYIRGEAKEIMKLHAEGKTAYEYIESRHLDPEEKLALWALLPSDVRSAIKRQAPQPALASQA